MKKTIRRPDGTVEELQGSPAEIRDYEGQQAAPVLVPTPFGLEAPWRYQFIPADEPCAAEEALKRDPNQTLGLVCFCPKCSPRCASVTYATSTFVGAAC